MHRYRKKSVKDLQFYCSSFIFSLRQYLHCILCVYGTVPNHDKSGVATILVLDFYPTASHTKHSVFYDNTV